MLEEIARTRRRAPPKVLWRWTAAASPTAGPLPRRTILPVRGQPRVDRELRPLRTPPATAACHCGVVAPILESAGGRDGVATSSLEIVDTGAAGQTLDLPEQRDLDGPSECCEDAATEPFRASEVPLPALEAPALRPRRIVVKRRTDLRGRASLVEEQTH